ELSDYLASAKTRNSSGADMSPVPQRTNRRPSGLLACLIIVALGVLGFVVLLDHNRAALDDATYQVTDKLKPPELRAYLLNPHHTRHRQEAERALEMIYAYTLTTIRKEAREPALGAAFADLIAGLQT